MINGLILSGGQSSRMGEEKRLLNYHGQSQEVYLYNMLKPFCTEVFVSINVHQESSLPFIRDTFIEINSPMVGILSAFQQNPDTAWLVIACDMPYIKAETITELLDKRDATKKATAFENPQEHFPEPLITIYEPSIYPFLLEAYRAGRKSALRVLQQQDIALIAVSDPKVLNNINTPEAFVKTLLDLGDKIA
ncbi:NTP transferase domain-containing protein [Flectobacillus major]|uniref:NTP transferase domain-containing protein n=1 Tax=Flectobacillus major TaxID=103 RepID=UPI0005C4A9EC|nr:NTP transferase domain-containing protein [Flectobacillus major]